MNEVYLQAVQVKKPISLALARLKAQQYIKNKKKTFVEETEDCFRFRNLPKVYFSSVGLKPINEEISLLVGHLNAKGTGASGVETTERADGS